MEKIRLPQVEIPEKGLYDWFVREIAEATKMTEEEITTLFKI